MRALSIASLFIVGQLKSTAANLTDVLGNSGMSAQPFVDVSFEVNLTFAAWKGLLEDRRSAGFINNAYGTVTYNFHGDDVWSLRMIKRRGTIPVRSLDLARSRDIT
jgi:hypothetical protein